MQIKKFQHINDFYHFLPPHELLMVDILRNIFIENLAAYTKEKFAFNVPFFYGNKGISIIWPASIPRGGFDKGVLMGFWQGNKLLDKENYLFKGINKKVYYRIFQQAEEIDIKAIINLIQEANLLDASFNKK